MLPWAHTAIPRATLMFENKNKINVTKSELETILLKLYRNCQRDYGFPLALQYSLCKYGPRWGQTHVRIASITIKSRPMGFY